MKRLHATHRETRPRLCFLGYRHLREHARPVIAAFRELADVELVDAALDDAVEQARVRVAAGQVDVFVSAGANAGMLRRHVHAPVATIQTSGLDVLRALLALAVQGEARRVGVVVYGETLPDLEAVKGLLRIEVEQRAYQDLSDARRAVAELQARGVTLIVGPSVVVEQAEAAGLQGRLAYSLESIRQGFEDAIELARAARLEAERTARLDAVLQTLEDAVLAVDGEHRVIACNPPMRRLLGVAPEAVVVGQDLALWHPALSLKDILAGGAADRTRVERLGRRHWVASRAPIQVAGQTVGATLTLYDARTIHEADARLRMQQGRHQAAARHHFSDIIGRSEAMQRALATAQRHARTDLTVLITGETGTGKELFAQAIHNAGSRSGRPFVAINCAAFPESLLESELFGYEEGAFTGARRGGKRGLFEMAHTGTVFLDEIGDMPLSLQTRLLRVLQEREVLRIGSTEPVPVDLRVIAATHQPLEDRVAHQRFRNDLFYRINTLRLQLPPLRDRLEDLEDFALLRLSQCLKHLGSPLSPSQALTPLWPRLRSYAWPGNMRELDNLSERLAAYLLQFDDDASVHWTDLPLECPELFAAPLPASAAHAGTRAERAQAALAAHQGRRSAAAEALGISRATLWRWLSTPVVKDDGSRSG